MYICIFFPILSNHYSVLVSDFFIIVINYPSVENVVFPSTHLDGKDEGEEYLMGRNLTQSGRHTMHKYANRKKSSPENHIFFFFNR